MYFSLVLHNKIIADIGRNLPFFHKTVLQRNTSIYCSFCYKPEPGQQRQGRKKFQIPCMAKKGKIPFLCPWGKAPRASCLHHPTADPKPCPLAGAHGGAHLSIRTTAGHQQALRNILCNVHGTTLPRRQEVEARVRMLQWAPAPPPSQAHTR